MSGLKRSPAWVKALAGPSDDCASQHSTRSAYDSPETSATLDCGRSLRRLLPVWRFLQRNDAESQSALAIPLLLNLRHHHVIAIARQLFRTLFYRISKTNSVNFLLSSHNFALAGAAAATAILYHVAAVGDAESSDKRSAQADQTSAKDAGAARLISEERRLLESLHRQAQEAQFGCTQSRESKTEHR